MGPLGLNTLVLQANTRNIVIFTSIACSKINFTYKKLNFRLRS